jgi:flavin reductase (DIM6/NTAB) family NADH-FMN oxidoreductase RutF
VSTAVSPDDLKAVHRSFPTGVTIVTAVVDGEPRGLVVNAFASISLSPPLIMVAIQRATATHEFLFRGRHFAVNILASDQMALAQRFAQPLPDKFEGVAWEPGRCGAPVLAGSAALLEAQIEERAQATTHTVFVGRVTRAEAANRPPLLYMGSQFYDAAAVGPPLTVNGERE